MKTASFEKELKSYLRKELKDYSKMIGPMTKGERYDLNIWVASGKSVYDNPHWLYDDSGQLMDYITAHRISAEMLENPSSFSCGDSPELLDADAERVFPF